MVDKAIWRTGQNEWRVYGRARENQRCQKRMVEEISYKLALLCEQSVIAVNEASSDHTEQYDDDRDLYLEWWCLARFAVDFAVTNELGQTDPQKRNRILDGCSYFILYDFDITEFPSNFIEKLNHRLEKYEIALKRGRDLSSASRSVGIEFAQSLGLTEDHILASGATNYFGLIVCDVIDILRSYEITQE